MSKQVQFEENCRCAVSWGVRILCRLTYLKVYTFWGTVEKK